MSSFFFLLSLLLLLSNHSTAVPLCELAVHGEPGAPAGAPKAAAAPLSSRFPTITYALSSVDAIGYIARSGVATALAKAFNQWGQIIPVNFVNVTDYDAALVKVGFYDDLTSTFETGRDGSGSVAIRMSAKQWWTADDTEHEWSFQAYDLQTVFLHAIGQLLGIPRMNCYNPKVCKSSLLPRTREFLSDNDVVEAQAICGANPNFDTRFLPASDSEDHSNDVLWMIVAVAVVTIIWLLCWCCCC